MRSDFGALFQQQLHYKVDNYPLTKTKTYLSRSERKQVNLLGGPLPFQLFTNSCVINRFIFGQEVVIYYILGKTIFYNIKDENVTWGSSVGCKSIAHANQSE